MALYSVESARRWSITEVKLWLYFFCEGGFVLCEGFSLLCVCLRLSSPRQPLWSCILPLPSLPPILSVSFFLLSSLLFSLRSLISTGQNIVRALPKKKKKIYYFFFSFFLLLLKYILKHILILFFLLLLSLVDIPSLFTFIYLYLYYK